MLERASGTMVPLSLLHPFNLQVRNMRLAETQGECWVWILVFECWLLSDVSTPCQFREPGVLSSVGLSEHWRGGATAASAMMLVSRLYQ